MNTKQECIYRVDGEEEVTPTSPLKLQYSIILGESDIVNYVNYDTGQFWFEHREMNLSTEELMRKNSISKSIE